ncbi:YDG domain-containing protein, partial [Hydrogenophaga sp.]|uniref:YDG domain-containing protein n=1 Tax=Hydrogenophaga sp. TaxID=1904254 RepID=UPI0027348224
STGGFVNAGSYNQTAAASTTGNYTYAAVTTPTANDVVTPLTITASGITAADKVYDATTSAVLDGSATVTALGSDDVTVSATVGTFDTKNVGTNKVVTLSGATLDGDDAGNYSVINQASTTANITTKNLTVSGATTISTYTGNVQTNTLLTPVGLLGSDKVTGVSGLATRTLVGLSVDSLSTATGDGLSNYSISYVNGSLAIVPVELTVTPPLTPTDTIVYLQSSAHSSLKIVQDELLCPSIFSIPLASSVNISPAIISNKCTTDSWNPSLQIFNGGVLLPLNGGNL